MDLLLTGIVIGAAGMLVAITVLTVLAILRTAERIEKRAHTFVVELQDLDEDDVEEPQKWMWN